MLELRGFWALGVLRFQAVGVLQQWFLEWALMGLKS